MVSLIQIVEIIHFVMVDKSYYVNFVFSMRTDHLGPTHTPGRHGFARAYSVIPPLPCAAQNSCVLFPTVWWWWICTTFLLTWSSRRSTRYVPMRLRRGDPTGFVGVPLVPRDLLACPHCGAAWTNFEYRPDTEVHCLVCGWSGFSHPPRDGSAFEVIGSVLGGFPAMHQRGARGQAKSRRGVWHRV